MSTQRIIPGDCLAGLRTLPDSSIHCCVTSPPYWGLRDYGHDGQIGLESTPEAYVARMVEVFREVRRVLREDGTLWLNLGDSYAAGKQGRDDNTGEDMQRRAAKYGSGTGRGRGPTSGKQRPAPPGLKPKDLCGIPWRVAFALQADGWWLRQDIIWHKPNPMPESVTDRCTKAHEYVFLLTKSQRYFYDAEAVKEQSARPELIGKTRNMRKNGADSTLRNDSGREAIPYCDPSGRNRRSVWTITTKPYSGAHFAVMPADLVEPCIKAGTSEHGCCPACGKPWERIVARTAMVLARSERTHTKGQTRASGTMLEPPRCNTLGWQQSCDCDCPTPDVVASTVLDPFAGSGTTLAVAAELGRNGIGCELNPEYIALAERRIKDARASVALFEGAVA
jgi:DNA modification methylase